MGRLTRKKEDLLDKLDDPKDLEEETNPEVLFGESQSSDDAHAYIQTCPGCGSTVTRGDYKCPKCGKLLI